VDQAVVVEDVSPSVAVLVAPRVAHSVEETPTVTTVVAVASVVHSDRDHSALADRPDSRAISRCARNSRGVQVIQYRAEMCHPLVVLVVQARLHVPAFSVRLVPQVLVRRLDPEAPQLLVDPPRPLQGLVVRHRFHHPRRSRLLGRIRVQVTKRSRRDSLVHPSSDPLRDRPRFGALIQADLPSRRRIELA